MENKNRKILRDPLDDVDWVEKRGVLENIAVLIAFLSVFGFFIKIIFF